MLKLLLLPFFILLLLGIAMILLAWQLVMRWWRNLTMSPEERQRVEEEYFKRTAYRNYSAKGEDETSRQQGFGDDYFNRDTEFEELQKRKAEARKQQQQQRRTTRAEGGVTIIDSRTPKEHRKIIPENDGEYVSFEEQ